MKKKIWNNFYKICTFINEIFPNTDFVEYNITVPITSSFNPLKIYLYKDGFVKLCTHKYTKNFTDLDDRFMHLTNYHINRNEKSYKLNNDYIHLTNIDINIIISANKYNWSSSSFNKSLIFITHTHAIPEIVNAVGGQLKIFVDLMVIL